MIDIVLVNWNSGNQLGDAILSISENHEDLVGSVIVVDNNSSDDSLAVLENGDISFPFSLRVIRNLKNMGFACACNQGAQCGRSEYVLFLNPDAKLFPGSLSISHDRMSGNEYSSTGICGVQLIDLAGKTSRSCARFPTALGFMAHALALNRIFPKTSHHMAEWDHAQTRYVDHVIGAFFLVRRTLYESLQGFDERFFVYLEDVDFSYRAHRAGWSSVYLTDARAFHAGGGTSNQVKAQRLFYSLRSRLLYAFKHFSFLSAVGVLLVTLLIEPFSRSAFALARGSAAGFKETWRAYGLLWRWLPPRILKGGVC
ncbi:glycosyltransferase family 2 protein [Variovorax paradoxus]|uniref:glycosyltransferase family 2 protein n=1 Tax=Variovorax paradoxus TaxID=34073 RepID=UPI000A502E48